MGEIGSDRGISDINSEGVPRGGPERPRGPIPDAPDGRGPHPDPRLGPEQYEPRSGRWHFWHPHVHHDGSPFGPRPGPDGDYAGPQEVFDGPYAYGPGRGDVPEPDDRFRSEGPRYRCHGPRFCWGNRSKTYIDIENEPKIDFLW
ncbi:hypothetical protein EVAR_3369_1 [Eumeta japonica]|uniref:Uncharacterized protein n=1 Tax=Eumeta variegata TaxID=151549 RepID=A0A4C1SST5_EUMVA|nr:hypothetical protein EVAR_3369_1 [Eumeta japonica]